MIDKRPAAHYPQVPVESRSGWRKWLADNHAAATGIFVVTWKKGRGPQVPYEEIVEEALCFGWIDGVARPVDADRSSLLLTPRRRGSGWSRVNKGRIERLLASGLMAEAGLAAIERAKADGSWTALDDVEALIEPAELRLALDGQPSARAAWDAFPRSAKRAILEWISTAKTAPTRSARIEKAVAEAAEGRRANQPRQLKSVPSGPSGPSEPSVPSGPSVPAS